MGGFRGILVGCVLGAVGGMAGCGYGFQSSRNPLKEKYGIERVYVAPVANDSFKAGVENLVYNQVVKRITTHGRLKLVSRPEDAEATLSGTVGSAEYGPSASTTADKLFPLGRGQPDTAVASLYTANLACSFTLGRRASEARRESQVWAGSFSRAKSFPGNNQIGAFGTTSPLINDSEFDRALFDLAESIASDLHESLLAVF